MNVKRIVANIDTPNPELAQKFYADLFELDLVMDHGWIKTLGSDEKMPIQISVASTGGSGTDVPDLSIEVDDLNAALNKVRSAGIDVLYGPVSEPWGVRRFYIRDPFGKLINVLEHE